MTIKEIITELTNWVNKDEVHSPAEWLHKANDLNILRSDLVNEITRTDIEYAKLVESYAQQDLSQVRSQNKAKIHGDGEIYMKLEYLKGRLKMVDELIRISKKRAELDKWDT